MENKNQILIDGTQYLDQDFPTPAKLEQTCLTLLHQIQKLDQKQGPHQLSLLFTTDTQMQQINQEHRQINSPTDVLSFPQLQFLPTDEIFPNPEGPPLLGDVIISVDTCRRQAQEIGHSITDECLRLLVHGILHLYGYDHEISPAEETRMQHREDQLLQTLENQTQ